MIRLPLLVGLSLLVVSASSCSSVRLPFLPGVQPADGQIVVEYFVDCRMCAVEYWTPRGLAVSERVQGEFRRTEKMSPPEAPEFVSLVAYPLGDDQIGEASIKVNGRVIDEGGRVAARGLAGMPVQLATCVGPGIATNQVVGVCAD